MGLRPRQPRRTTGLTYLAVLLSVLLHVPLLASLGLLQPDETMLEPTEFDAGSELEVSLVSEDPDAPEEEEKEEQVTEMQIVSFEPPDREETPEEAKYADQYESRSEREQVRKALPGAPAMPSQPTPPQPQVQPRPPQPAEAEPEPEPEPAEAAEAQAQMPEPTPVEDAELAQAQEESEAPKLVRESKESTDAAAEPTQPTPDQLFPSVAQKKTQEAIGEGGSLDYLRDVDEGDKTLLNRKRTRYWAFFDRIKVQVAEQWSPVEEYRRRDPYGNVYGVKDRYSTVHITLNGDGTVRQLYVSRGSGLDFFDEEAIRSIRAAAPFHNPPEGLKDEDGLIHFSFGFFFEINAGSGIPVFN